MAKAKAFEQENQSKKLEKTAKQLEIQYATPCSNDKKRAKKIQKTKKQKIASAIFDVFCVILVVFCGLTCFSVINSKLAGTPSTVAGYSIMKVVSGSMRASGFEIGSNIAVHSVNVKTLDVGDKIAFYVVASTYSQVDLAEAKGFVAVNSANISDVQYTNSFAKFFGLHDQTIISAGKSGARLVFHQIAKVYEDNSGMRWFQTVGTSNGDKNVQNKANWDNWFVRGDLVVGAYTNTPFSNFLASVVGVISSSTLALFWALLIPLILIAIAIFKENVNDLRIAMYENEIVSGKRKLNDPFCVKNKIGSNLSEKEKYKVLAQASDDEKIEYINLLWLGKKPVNIQKHYFRRRLKLSEYSKKTKLHEECAERYRNGEDITEIAKYYTAQKAAIEAQSQQTLKRLKAIKNNKKTINQA